MQSVATTQAGHAVCSSNNIADFFEAFAESPEIQRAYTASNVETAFVDWSAQPEPVEAVEPMPREKLHFPLVPNRVAQQQGGLRYREIAGGGYRAVVVLEVPDTDMQQRCTFRRDACWTLVKIAAPAFGKLFPGETPPAKTIDPPIPHRSAANSEDKALQICSRPPHRRDAPAGCSSSRLSVPVLRLRSRWSSNAPVRFAARHVDFRSPW